MDFKRLVYIRDENELNQTQIASILNVKQTLISTWETGAVIIPLDRLNDYSKYFKVSLDYLLSLSDTNNQKITYCDLDPKVVGNKLKEFRLKENVSQRALARELNTTSSTLCSYEQGKTLILTSFAYQICKKYNISLDWLCGKSDNIHRL